MTDFEREDLELKELMGERFHDMTEAKPVPKVEEKKTPTKVEVKTIKKVDEPEWRPTKEHTWMDSLKGCVKWAVTFGGLNMLIFYWQLHGLMAESIAVPCMWVCCALAGYGVGRNVWRGAK